MTDYKLDDFHRGLMRGKLKEQLDLMEKNMSTRPKAEAVIPPIIHQIWVGERPIPDKYKKYMRTVRELNPEFKYMFWNNETIVPILESDEYRIFMSLLGEERLTFNMGLAGDVLRMLILYEYGGVYIDVDYELFCPLDMNILHYDYCGTFRLIYGQYFSDPNLYTSPIHLCSSFIALPAKSPMYVLFSESIRKRLKEKRQMKLDDWIRLLSQARINGDDGVKKYMTAIDAMSITYRLYHEAALSFLANPNQICLVLGHDTYNAIDTFGGPRLRGAYRFYWEYLKYIFRARKIGFDPLNATTERSKGLHHSKASWLNFL